MLPVSLLFGYFFFYSFLYILLCWNAHWAYKYIDAQSALSHSRTHAHKQHLSKGEVPFKALVPWRMSGLSSIK